MKFFVPAIFLRQMKTHRSLGRHCISNRSYDADITELNKLHPDVSISKEKELAVGHPLGSAPKTEVISSRSAELAVGHPLGSAPKTEVISSSPGLTHVDTSGHAQMVDVSWKQDSKRVAVAGCRVLLGEKVFKMVASNQIAKGDVLTVAKIAGINGAKKSSSLIPLCHNIGLTHVRVDLSLNERDLSVEIEGEAATTAKTGVEMEAMTAVAVASLTVYDMCKAASKDIQISELRLHSKERVAAGPERSDTKGIRCHCNQTSQKSVQTMQGHHNKLLIKMII